MKRFNQQQRNIAILFFTMVVMMIGFGIIIPIIPFYIEALGVGGKELGLMMAIFSIMQFIFAPFWGSLSDRFGRKPILVLGVLGNAISLVLMGFSTTYWMLLGSRALAGVLSSATMPTAMAYIADSTSERDRGGGMGVIGAAMGIGMVLGPGLGGWAASSSLAMPFFLAAGLSGVALLLLFFFLPESLAPAARSTDVRLAGPKVKDMWMALAGPLGILFFLAFLVSFAMTNFEGIFGLYALHQFDYGPQQVGSILTVIGLISAIAQGLLTGPATRRWGEVKVIKTSLLASAIGFVLMLLAVDFATVLLTVGFFVLANTMLRPSLSSLISKMAREGQGLAMGLTNSFMSLGRVVGPLWAGFLFDINIHLPYLSGAMVMLAGFGLSLFYLLKHKHEVVAEDITQSS
jgi:DHA1 family multidrug resistance protein-like MFS transporter